MCVCFFFNPHLFPLGAWPAARWRTDAFRSADGCGAAKFRASMEAACVDSGTSRPRTHFPYCRVLGFRSNRAGGQRPSSKRSLTKLRVKVDHRAESSGSGKRSRRRRSRRYAAESKRTSGLVGRAVKTPGERPPLGLQHGKGGRVAGLGNLCSLVVVQNL